MNLIFDGSDGVIAYWADCRNGSSDIYAQRISSDGTCLWNINGIMAAGGIGDQGHIEGGGFYAASDYEDGFILAWVDNRDAANRNLYCQRISGNGQLLWTGDPQGQPLCVTEQEQNTPMIVPDGSGGAFIVWKDRRNEPDYYTDLYCQRLDADGNCFFTENGIPLYTEGFFVQSHQIAIAGTGEFYVVWKDQNELYEYRIHVQKCSGTDSLLYHWGESSGGIALTEPSLDLENIRIDSHANGGLVVNWNMDHQPPENDIIYTQWINEDGNPVWNDGNPVEICNDISYRRNHAVAGLTNGNTFVAWLDFRSGSPSLYRQMITPDGDVTLEDNGELLMEGIDYNARRPQLIRSGPDYIIGWIDGRCMFSSIPFLQKIDNNGQVLWETGGISATPSIPFGEEDTLYYHTDSLSIAPDSAGGVYCAWANTWDSNYPAVYMQRLSQDGVPLWNERGMTITSDPGIEQNNPIAITAPNGDLIVVYQQLMENYTFNLYAQRFSPTGTRLWGEEGLQMTFSEQDDIIHDVHSDPENGILVCYHLNYQADSEHIYCIGIDWDGELLWEEPLLICNEEAYRHDTRIVPVDNGVVLAWDDRRRGEEIVDLYGQYITWTGNTQWETNGLLLQNIETTYNHIFFAESVNSNATDFWVGWSNNDDQYLIRTFVQKYSLSGTPQLQPAEGVQVFESDENRGLLNLHVPPSNCPYVIAATEHPEQDIVYMHLSPDGSRIHEDFPMDGAVLCNAYHRQNGVVTINDGDNGVVAVWEDYRSSIYDYITNIYAQRINDGMGWVNPDARRDIPKGFEIVSLYPNPFNTTTRAVISIPSATLLNVSVYDLLGREVAVLHDGPASPGYLPLHWHANGASGTYFLRISGNGQESVQRMFLVR